MITKFIRHSRAFCLGLALISGAGLAACGGDGGGVAKTGTVTSVGVADIGGPFALTTHTGERFTQDNLVGKPTLLYFGFSYCPDVCPTALQKMGAVQERVDPDGTKLQYVFAGVDVQRDTPESLAPYVASRGFAKGLIGLAGTQEEMDVATAAWRVYAQKIDDPESAAEYTFDHSDLMIVTGAGGEFITMFTRNDSLVEMETRLKFLLDTGQ